jgi:hypothetical protein
VEEYGRELQMPPEVVFDNLDVNEIEDAITRASWVLVDLWTVEEGRSDLKLEIRLTDTGGEPYDIEINNLHVLQERAGDTQTKSLRSSAHAHIHDVLGGSILSPPLFDDNLASGRCHVFL